MADIEQFVQSLRRFGTGRRQLQDDLFFQDKLPQRVGIFNDDEDDLCEGHALTACSIAGCDFAPESMRDYENHYNATHRYSCSECKKVLPSPHFLDLHIQEVHDSFFAVMAAKKASYCCYIQECQRKFMTAEDRMTHCVEVHKFPKDFRFDNKISCSNKTKDKNVATNEEPMEESPTSSGQDKRKISLNNSKQKTFSNRYSGKQFTSDKMNQPSTSVNIDEIITDIKANLPK